MTISVVLSKVNIKAGTVKIQKPIF